MRGITGGPDSYRREFNFRSWRPVRSAYGSGARAICSHEGHTLERNHTETGGQERDPKPVRAGWHLVKRGGEMDKEKVTAVKEGQDENRLGETMEPGPCWSAQPSQSPVRSCCSENQRQNQCNNPDQIRQTEPW